MQFVERFDLLSYMHYALCIMHYALCNMDDVSEAMLLRHGLSVYSDTGVQVSDSAIL